MIGRLSGILLEKNPPQLLLDVQGVAYEVDVPMSTFYNLPAERRARHALHASRRARGRAPAVRLRHARTSAARSASCSRSTASARRIALSVLSGLSVAELAQAVTLQETGRLTRDPGHRQEDRRAAAARAEGQARRRRHAGRRRQPRAAGHVGYPAMRCCRSATARRKQSPRSSSCPTASPSPTASGRRCRLLAKA